MKRSRNKLYQFVAAACLPISLTAQAQLEEVIVTATRIETSIQDTPIAVSTAFTQDQLDSQLINDTMSSAVLGSRP
jgi:outer membrane receptor protein involved in Fe transport